MGPVAKVQNFNALGSHMSTGSNPGDPASHSVCCLWPGKAVEAWPKPCDTSPMWETQKRLLDPGYELAHLWLLWLIEEWIIRCKIFLSVSHPLCISAFPIKINIFFDREREGGREKEWERRVNYDAIKKTIWALIIIPKLSKLNSAHTQ